MSTFRGLGEVIAENGLFCSLYADRASHYWHTPEAGGGVDKDNPTQVGTGLAQLGIELSGLFAAGPGPLGAHVRDLAEAPAPGAAPRRDRHHGRGQSLSRGARLAGAQRPLRPPGRGHRLGLRGFCRHARGHPLRPGGPRRRGRQHRALKNRTLQIPADRHRHHYVKAQVRVHEYPDGHLAVFHGPRCLARYRADGETIDDDRLQAA